MTESKENDAVDADIKQPNGVTQSTQDDGTSPVPSSASVSSKTKRWHRLNVVGVIGLMMLCGFIYVLFHLITVSEQLIHRTALADADKFNAAIAEFRTVYTAEVVSRAKGHGMEICHDYDKKDNAIPLPATLSMMIGNRLGNRGDSFATRLFSDYPFPWRKDGGPKTEFEHRALSALRKNPDQPYYEFSQFDKEAVLQYATADRMRQSCIECHNSRADSPKTDWKVGDVRGVLSITMPMTHAISQGHAAFEETSTLLVLACVSTLSVFAFVLRRLNRQKDTLRQANIAMTSKQHELIAAQRKVEQSNDVLRDKAGQIERARQAALNLMSDMEQAKKAADAASQAKSNFLANMSHEIRTPMTAIIGFSDLLVDSETSQHDRENAIRTINRNGKHLLDLINDILDLSRIESGHMEFEIASCQPIVLLQDVHELLSERATAKNLELRLTVEQPMPATIQTDAMRVKQAVVNLVGNAIKFTESGVIQINASCDLDQQLLTITVQDSGIGMSSDQLERIFEPFSQADNSMTRRFGGTGLGLAITRNIARAFDGDVVVTSEPGQGSTFRLTVATGDLQTPAESDQGTNEAVFESKKKPATKLHGRVLLVEDGPDNQVLVSFLLRKAGAEVVIANHGQEALDEIHQASEPFDLILMDMQMPVMDGYTATRQLRAESFQGQIVALTAHALSEEIQKCLDAGCDSYLRKPIEKEIFFEEIQQRIGQPSTLSEAVSATEQSTCLQSDALD